MIGPNLVATAQPFGGITSAAPFTGTINMQSGQSFLIGFWLDSQTPLNSPPVEDRFGWVRLSYTPQGGLVMIDSATSIGDGIIAGTTTTVPEAATFLMAGLSSCLLLRKRRTA